MVLHCIVPGCTEKSRNGKAVSFHHLPTRDIERTKKWLRAINNPKVGEDTDIVKLKTQRICSLHFTKEDFELNVLGMKRIALLDTATPSIFFPKPKDDKGKRKRNRNQKPDAQASIAEAETETTVVPTAAGTEQKPTDYSSAITCTNPPAKKTSSVSGFFKGLQGNVQVNLDCLLQLFKKCDQCKAECVTDVEGDWLRFMVVQRCQNCYYLNTWWSQPQKMEKKVNSPCVVRMDRWIGGLRIIQVDEEAPDNGENAETSSRIETEITIDTEEERREGEKDNEEEVASEDAEDGGFYINEDGDYEEEEEEEGGNTKRRKDSDDEWKMEEGEVEEEQEKEQKQQEVQTEEKRVKKEREEGEGEKKEKGRRGRKPKGGEKKGVEKPKSVRRFQTPIWVNGRVPKSLRGQKILCPDCGVMFSTSVHKCDPRKKFQCPDCDRMFVSESCLDAHRSTVCGKINHRCKFCLQPCHTMQEKLIHQKTHPKKSPYLCSECPETFKEEVPRNKHLKEQHPKNHECPTCHKKFRRGNHLSRHVLSHRDEKPFKCQECGRQFAQASQLKCHLRVHTGETPYQCSFCPKGFNHNVSLKNHISRYHYHNVDNQHISASDDVSPTGTELPQMGPNDWQWRGWQP